MNQNLFLWAQTDFLSLDRIKVLRETFGNLETAWEKGTPESFRQAKIHPRGVEAFFRKKKGIDFQKAQEDFEKSDAKMLFIEDKEYPEILREIPSAPIFLFYKGKLPDLSIVPSLAVVGSRAFSSVGKEAVARIIPDLTRSGFCIVSGLARGIDAMAHKECLDNNGITLAVLGSGIDRVWPYENCNLARSIVEKGGAIISEFPMGTTPLGYNFPRRNRIISGLSRGVLVIEGRIKSGSLITAHNALEQGREVFAVPGNAFMSHAEGTNGLIQKGEAKLVASAQDILEEFSMEVEKAPKRKLPEGQSEQEIIKILSDGVKLFDEIVIESGLNPSQISPLLTVLEMKGYVKNVGINQWTSVI